MSNSLIPIDNLPEETRAVVLPIVQSFSAVLETIAEDNRQKTEQIEKMAADYHLMSQRMTELEKQVRLQKPLSKTQENYINAAIRRRVREILEEKGIRDDRKAATALGSVIRKAILSRYGVGSLREAPAYDYETALEEAHDWMDFMELRKIIREARARAEGSK